MRAMAVVGTLAALAIAACGSSSGITAKTDASADGSRDMSGDSTAGRGGGGQAGAAGAGTAGEAGTGGTAGAGESAGGAGAGGTKGAGGAAGQGGAAAARDGGTDAHTDGGGCQSQNPDPCICGRPDANSISAAECVREKACRAAGGVWEPYFVELAEGGSYGPRCQTADGSVFDAN
jgi:hypothetical protein